MMPRYAILTCPVCWSDVEFSDDKPSYRMDEYLVLFCDEGCFSKFKENEEYYVNLIRSMVDGHEGCCCGGNCGCGGH